MRISARLAQVLVGAVGAEVAGRVCACGLCVLCYSLPYVSVCKSAVVRAPRALELERAPLYAPKPIA
eukprot:scaffold3644_cov107-Isochrysis_galbana.AAC.14